MTPLISWAGLLAIVGLLYAGVLVQAIVISTREWRGRRRRQRAYSKRLRIALRGSRRGR